MPIVGNGKPRPESRGAGRQPVRAPGADAAVLLGSSRGDGNTRMAVDLALGGTAVEVIDLGQLDIGMYDYDHANASDDFLPLVERLASKSLWILATPVYWYAMSGRMKVFLDRLSDLVTIRKARGRSLKGTTVAVMASGTDTALPEGFEAPFRQTCDYLGMRYAGALYVQFGDERVPVRDHSVDVARFVAGLFPDGGEEAPARACGPAQGPPRKAVQRAPGRIPRCGTRQPRAPWPVRVPTGRCGGLCSLAEAAPSRQPGGTSGHRLAHRRAGRRHQPERNRPRFVPERLPGLLRPGAPRRAAGA